MTELETAILERLKTVIDPETNIDVVRMRLVENLWADTLGKVRYTFRPSSFVCPISLPDKTARTVIYCLFLSFRAA